MFGHDLSFNCQIGELCKKLEKRGLHHISPYLKRNQQDIQLYNHYGSMIWTSCGNENLLKVLRLQKCAMF